MKPIGPVYQYTEGGIAGPGEILAFDSFEPDLSTDVPTDGRYGVPACFPSAIGNRWYFGTTYDNPDLVGDMTLAPGTAGMISYHYEQAWYFYPPAAENCNLIIWPTEDFDYSCYGPAFTTSYNGINLGFGSLNPGGYYWHDFSNSTLGLQLPLDGVGGYYWVSAQSVTATQIILSTNSQPMLWGTKDALGTPPGTCPSHQDTHQWDDDSPPDGTLVVAECYTYNFGICPEPLGAMICFWVVGGCAVPCDANCDGYFDGADIDPFFLLLQDPDLWSQTYPGCDQVCAGDANFDNYVDGADIDAFFVGLTNGFCAPQ